ncbi:hypothetical protein ACI2L4_01610 [Streptomyces sparsogenes]|uniref:hypothetical protein n=1 Tax=Streptomyces sparsogenes TaxID=67365 RepID=UPI0033C695FD
MTSVTAAKPSPPRPSAIARPIRARTAATVELAGRDARAAGMLERDTSRRLAALRAAIEQGRRDGSITSTRDAGAPARFVNATIGGMRVSSQGGADRATLEAIAEVVMDALTH